MDARALWDELEASLPPLLLGFRARLDTLDVSEKADETLLSEADIAVQEHIVARIKAYDPGASIVAEETGEHLREPASSGRIWIVDPIDGTAEFVRPGRREYCSVVCLLADRRPVGALVVAPEIGTGGIGLSVRVDGIGAPMQVNGRPARHSAAAAPRRVSVTRSSSVAARPWERLMADAGFELKTRTTSQTLDMVRTCVDLSEETGGELPPFALFYREAQKVWDGAAGMCLAQSANLRVCDRHGVQRDLVNLDLTVDEPTFASTVVAAPPLAAQFLAWSSG
ncbi:inositol monophosphatase family protein [Micromonospora sp. WMMD1102]|uniref:inositol monophosphatase family protein n=1 Tax=Micromonospora sp. WMMD1102 TaxID=3016105 RepID=UPI00241584F1|nr:inositol monophosphatase family protein [Micromonospora sp. WMMD1102]MDG4789075.1 inositol monophosphatase family protein [Micromonospora sp. WMMD1102]